MDDPTGAPIMEPGPVTAAFQQVTQDDTVAKSYADRNADVFAEAQMLARAMSVHPETGEAFPPLANAFVVGFLTGVFVRHGGPPKEKSNLILPGDD